MTFPSDPIRWFSETLQLTGVAHITPEKTGKAEFIGKRLGLINGASWITPWTNYFGRLYLPGVHLLNAGNEAVQLNFMDTHERGLPTPPQSSIDAFVGYARELAELGHVNAILITCSTMNRSYPAVQAAMQPYGIPVVQIDRPMMERAVRQGGKTLVIATHGPTVASTQALLRETAAEAGTSIDFVGETVEEAWYCLAEGDVVGHNQHLMQAIRRVQKQNAIDSVVLAQLSMTVFQLSYPDPVTEFGVPVFTSGQCGFEALASLLAAL
jgi:aspartate/glutamate racemase